MMMEAQSTSPGAPSPQAWPEAFPDVLDARELETTLGGSPSAPPKCPEKWRAPWEPHRLWGMTQDPAHASSLPPKCRRQNSPPSVSPRCCVPNSQRDHHPAPSSRKTGPPGTSSGVGLGREPLVGGLGRVGAWLGLRPPSKQALRTDDNDRRVFTSSRHMHLRKSEAWISNSSCTKINSCPGPVPPTPSLSEGCRDCSIKSASLPGATSLAPERLQSHFSSHTTPERPGTGRGSGQGEREGKNRKLFPTPLGAPHPALPPGPPGDTCPCLGAIAGASPACAPLVGGI